MPANRTRRYRMAPFLFGILLISSGLVSAEEAPTPPKTVSAAPAESPVDRRSHKRKGKEVTHEQEELILKFVAEHHSELATLLQTLREKDSQQFQIALHDLRATTERITRLQSKNPKRYEAELESWKVQSRIRLLRARGALQPEGVPESDLRTLLDREIEARLRLLKLERDEHAARLASLNEEIRLTEENRAQDVDHELKRALRKSKARPTSPRSKPSTRRKAASTSAAPEAKNPEK